MQNDKEANHTSQCPDTNHTFVITAITRSARNAIELTALTPKSNEEKWNWINDFLVTVDVKDGGVDGLRCASLKYHEKSLVGAQVITQAMIEVIKEADKIASDFENSRARFSELTILSEPM